MHQGMAAIVICGGKAAIDVDGHAVFACHLQTFLIIDRGVAENDALDSKFLLHFLFESEGLHVVLPEQGSLGMGGFVFEEISLKGFHGMLAEEG